MKKLTLIRLSVCALAILVCSPSFCQADWPPGRHMAESMAINLGLGANIEKNSNYGFHDTCYLGAFIRPGNNSFLTMQLDAGQDYLFTGAVHQGCDLDIIVEDSSGRVVARDTKADNIPIVVFAPNYTDKYTVRLKLHSAAQAQFCGMVLLKKGGWSIPVANLGTAGESILELCQQIARKRNTRFLEVPGEWALIGQVMKSDTSTTFSGIRLGGGRRAMVAAGDNNSDDIDLVVSRDAKFPAQLISDTQRDNIPLVDLQANETSSYSVETRNVRSSGATIIMTALLDID